MTTERNAANGLVLLFCGTTMALLSSPLWAEIAQELKWQGSYAQADEQSLLAQLGAENITLATLNYRFRYDWQADRWAFDFDAILDAQWSDQFDTLMATSPNSVSSDWFDWRHDILREKNGRLRQSVDRANVRYSREHWTFKLGRQAITWGNGVLFHPMDLFNPFSPSAIDTSYKPGIDMFYAQRLFDSGGDLQLLWVPHASASNEVKDSYAAKALFLIERLQLETLFASDYGDPVVGFGLVGPLGEAIWKMDWITQRWNGENFHSLDLNLQYSWQWGEYPVSGFIEYYRNGLVSGSLSNLELLDPALWERVERGQLFSLGEDQLAIGFQLQCTPLLTLSPSVIQQLNDQSRLWLISASYSSDDNANWVMGLQLSQGHAGTQYGGWYLDATQQTLWRSPEQWYLRYEHYF